MCLCEICIPTVIAKGLLLNKDRNDVVSHKRGPIAVGERRMMISHRVRRNEIAECLSEFLRVAVDIAKVRGDIKVFL